MNENLVIAYKVVSRDQFTDEMKILEKVALEVATKAYAPYSHFSVGAAALLDNGEIVVGSNQENAAYPSGICAERTCLFHAGAIYPESAVKSLLVLAINAKGERAQCASPCGACRQVLLEVSDRFKQPFKVYLPGEDSAIVLDDNRSLLPFGFVASNMH